MPEQDPVDGAPRIAMAFETRLLADPDWIIFFCSAVNELVKAGRAMNRHSSMPDYCTMLSQTKWKPWLSGLAAHLMKVVEDGRNNNQTGAYCLDENIPEAYRLACAALEKWCMFDEGKLLLPSQPTEKLLTALEDVAELLSGWQAPPPPRENEQSAAVAASGDKMPEAPAIDYKALVDTLRRDGKATQARLVEFMADRDSASCEDVGREVHDDKDASDRTVRMNARRTNDELAKMDARVSFRVVAAKVYKEISPR